MIRNLNQMTFQGFGTVPPERNQSAQYFDKNAAKTCALSEAGAVVCRARTEVWVTSGSGMSVLSVSRDGEQYQEFYLDKPACILPGIYFSLSPFMGEATALMFSREEPETLNSRSLNDLRLAHQLRVDSIYTFFYHEKEQGFLFPGEAHPMAELTYVDQGSMHSVVEGQDLLLKQGDLVVYGPGQWHMQYADIGVAPRYVTISFAISGLELAPLLNRKFAAPQKVVSLLQKMLQEQERMDAYSNDIILSQLNLLLLLLLRESTAPKGGKLQTSNAIHSENEIIRQAQQFISSHIREKLSVPLVARQVDVSPSYLTALFHKNLQISPGEYIRRIKLQESKQMIRENNLNFTEIAAELQYSTVHHFSRQFKEKFGITPTEYAKSVR
ncbi:MAG: helix-turn-helix transcriptional regulator [Oscillospiraceae bacterium]|nr:helix-turn-helix transcriptional regulator [Oscillospiraceae bacterium]